jgi:hypothetical protein
MKKLLAVLLITFSVSLFVPVTSADAAPVKAVKVHKKHRKHHRHHHHHHHHHHKKIVVK